MNPYEKILYLTKAEWISSWTQGGKVPLSHDSKYKGLVRQGTQTIDEGLCRDLKGVSYKHFNKAVKITHDKNCSVILGAIKMDGKIVGKNINFHQEEIGGVVLCLSNKFDSLIAQRLNKTAAVIISDYSILKKHLDQQLGVESSAAKIKYTTGGNRGHFLKHKDDEWQNEFRLLWPLDVQEVQVTTPMGIVKEYWRA